jgi:biotin-[acetyl-CoA-carboxylase] ligase BirA-like protein
MITPTPELPAAYELIYLENVADLRAYAINLSEAGAEEGTLVWASSQSNARGRLNQQWLCNPGDLHCAIILRPEDKWDKLSQFFSIAAVSLSHALATHLSAMTSLGFNWPNDISIAAHKVGSIWIDASRSVSSPWLTITASVNIENSPDDLSIPAISVKEAEGETELNSQLLLETYARQFITQINNWSERGNEVILKQWRPRIEGLGLKRTIKLATGEVTGILENINADGDATLKLIDNTTCKLSLAQCLEYVE